jgi:hypothetical protein
MRVPIGAFDFGQQSFDARVSDSDVRCGAARDWTAFLRHLGRSAGDGRTQRTNERSRNGCAFFGPC